MLANSSGIAGLHYDGQDLADLFERTARTIAMSVELRRRSQAIRSARRTVTPPREVS
jgi:hypothetical protein